MTPAKLPRMAALVAIAALLSISVAACGSSSSSGTTTTSGATTTSAPTGGTTHGTASVAYADSLELLFTTVLQKSFQQMTGDNATGRANGSTTLASEILSNEITPGVFIAVGKKAIKKLWPKDRSKFLVTLATDPLVVAYNPNSKYAAELDAISTGQKPLSDLFTLLETPGLRIGRTDPNADPQGVYFLLMMMLAQKELGLSFNPAETVLGVSSSQPFGKTSQMVDSDSLISDLQAGEFDVSSAYLTQAVQSHLKYIALPSSLNFSDPAKSAEYGTVSITLTDGTVDQGDLVTLNVTLVEPADSNSANASADEAFVSYLMSPTGSSDLKAGGYTVAAPVFQGASSSDTPSNSLPSSVQTTFNTAGGTTSSG